MVYGMIMLWHGEAGTIPPGFAVCDGTNGTPNLRNKFIVGAGDTYAVNDTGGALTHTHPFTSNGHFHTLGPEPTFLGTGAYRDKVTDSKTDSGTTDAGNSLPPYHALLYIMYVGL